MYVANIFKTMWNEKNLTFVLKLKARHVHVLVISIGLTLDRVKLQ